MPKFRVYVEETATRVWYKEFDADDKESAEALAAKEVNLGTAASDETPGWVDDMSSTAALEVREELTEEVEKNPREKGDDDGVEYGDPRDELDERD